MTTEAMGNCGDHRDEMFDPDTDWAAHSGTGSITTLPMSKVEKAAAKTRPIGFVWPAQDRV